MPQPHRVIYTNPFSAHDDIAFGEHSIPQASQPRYQIKIMGDKSPKANQKKSGQKQTKSTSAAANKKAAVASKQSPAKKK